MDQTDFFASSNTKGMPFRLLLVSSSVANSGGGVTESLRLLCRALHASGLCSFEVFALKDRFSAIDQFAWAPVPVRTFGVVGPRRYGFSPTLLWALLRYRADIVHVHGLWMFHCLAAYVWAQFYVKPYIITPHGMLERWIRARSPLLKFAVSAIYQNRFLRNADQIHLLTCKEVMDLDGIASDAKFRIIPNYVRQDSIKYNQPGWWTDELCGRKAFLFLGRIHEKKGWRELCEAWNVVNEAGEIGSKAALIFCGWIDQSPDFERTIARLNARFGNVRFVGPLYGAEKAATIAAASVFILPSKSEGLPMAVLEAWAAGKPTLLTEACNLPEGFQRGAALRIGIDAISIAEGIREAIGWSQEEQARMGEAARTLVREKYSEAAVTQAILAMYHEVIERARERQS